MAKTSTKSVREGKGASKAVAASTSGIHTAKDLANVLAAMIQDLLADRISTATANSVSSVSGKLLKIAELQYKHDRVKTQRDRKPLLVAD